jgi:hypothetical protein
MNPRTAQHPGIRLLALAAMFAAALLAGGCGSSTTKTVTQVQTAAPTTTPATTPTAAATTAKTPSTDAAAQYLAVVTQIDDRLGAIDLPKNAQFGTSEFAIRALAAAARVRAIATDLDALTPPPQARPQHESLLARLQGVEGDFRKLAAASDNRDHAAAADALSSTNHKLDIIRGNIKAVQAKLG